MILWPLPLMRRMWLQHFSLSYPAKFSHFIFYSLDDKDVGNHQNHDTNDDEESKSCEDSNKGKKNAKHGVSFGNKGAPTQAVEFDKEDE